MLIMPFQRFHQRAQQRLQQASALWFVVFAISAAFMTYFSMYAFRKPFSVAMYDGQTLFGMPNSYTNRDTFSK
jgi:DNA-binding MurR/RpiR family transcriptional regulator